MNRARNSGSNSPRSPLVMLRTTSTASAMLPVMLPDDASSAAMSPDALYDILPHDHRMAYDMHDVLRGSCNGMPPL